MVHFPVLKVCRLSCKILKSIKVTSVHCDVSYVTAWRRLYLTPSPAICRQNSRHFLSCQMYGVSMGLRFLTILKP